MNVLFIHDQEVPDADAPTLSVGGIGIYMKDVARELTKQGNKVSSIRLHSHAETVLPISHPGHYTARSSSVVRRLGLDRDLLKLIDKIAPDIIHLHSTYYSLGPWMMDLLAARAPTILTLHDVTPFCPAQTMLQHGKDICERPAGVACTLTGCYKLGARAPLLKDFVRLSKISRKIEAIGRLARIIVPSAYLRDVAVRNGIEPRQISIIPNYSRFGTPDSHPANGSNILFIGRFTAEKGAHHLAAALRLLRSQEWTATFVGAGTLENVLRDQLAQDGLLSRVSFQPWASDTAVRDFYKDAAVVAVPSLMPESFGMVGVEALSFGRAVVAYRSGGVEEWLGRNQASIAVSHGDIAGLAEGIDSALKHPQQFFEPARNLVRTRFLGAQHASSLESIYLESIYHVEIALSSGTQRESKKGEKPPQDSPPTENVSGSTSATRTSRASVDP